MIACSIGWREGSSGSFLSALNSHTSKLVLIEVCFLDFDLFLFFFTFYSIFVKLCESPLSIVRAFSLSYRMLWNYRSKTLRVLFISRFLSDYYWEYFGSTDSPVIEEMKFSKSSAYLGSKYWVTMRLPFFFIVCEVLFPGWKWFWWRSFRRRGLRYRF